MQCNFHKCEIADLDLLVAISRKTFVDAFESDNNPIDFKAYIDAAFDRENIKKQLNNPNSYFYFVFRESQLVGYFKLNVAEAQTDIKVLESIELERIYVLKDFQGNQIGKQMLQKTIEIAVKADKRFMWLGVWENNTNAIRFYQKYNFIKFDTHPYYIGSDKQTDWLMRLDLTNFVVN